MRWLGLTILLVGCGGGGGGPKQTDCGPGTALGTNGMCMPSTRPIDARGCVGKYGPITETATNTIFVDATAAAGGDGSAAHPFRSVMPAVDAAPAGATVAIAAGTYTENVAIAKALTVEASCARDVIIDGGVTITGTGMVVIHGIGIHGGTPGVSIAAAPTELRWDEITRSHGTGVVIDGADAHLLDSEVTATDAVQSGPDLTDAGSGIIARNASTIEVRNSIINMNRKIGVDVADMTGTLAAPTQTARSSGVINMNIIDGNGDSGVAIHAYDTTPVALIAQSIDITGGEIMANGAHGVYAQNALFSVVDVTIGGNGTAMKPGRPRALPLTSMYAGITALGCDATITGDTLDGGTGAGIVADSSSVSIMNATVKNFAGTGVVLSGVATPMTLATNTIDANGQGGGLIIADGALVQDNMLTGNTHVGIAVVGANDVIDGNHVTDTKALAGFDAYTSGHGIFTLNGTITITNNVVMGGDGIGIGDTCGSATDTGQIVNNMVTGAQLAGIAITSCQTGPTVNGNTIANVKGTGLRILTSLDPTSGAFVQLDGNTISGTTARTPGMDGDGVFIFDSGVLYSNGQIHDNARMGILVGGANSVGNISGVTLMGNLMDIVLEGSTGMSASGNMGGAPQSVPAGTIGTDVKPPSFMIPGN